MQPGLWHRFRFLGIQNKFHILLEVLIDGNGFRAVYFEIRLFFKPIKIRNEGRMNLEIWLDHDNKHFTIMNVRNKLFFFNDDCFMRAGVKRYIDELIKCQVMRFFFDFFSRHDDAIVQ